MNNKAVKSLLCIFTAVLTVVMTVLPLTATVSAKEAYPRIHVPGIMSSDIYVNVENPDEGIAWPPSSDSIVNLVKDCVPALLEFSVTRDWDKLGHSISPLAYSFFEKSMCDADGGITNGSGIIFNYPSKEALTHDGSSTFRYDWRADPMETAVKLNDYIDYVLSATGSDKVVIDCHSLGGLITLTYCTLYGHDKVDAIAFNSTAIYGENYTGDLFSGDIVLSNDSLMSYMDFAFDATEQEELFDRIFNVLERAGLGELVANIGNKILEKLSYILIPEVVAPLFSGWLTIWAMVPDDKIDYAMNYTFENYLPKDSQDAVLLRQKIENYNNTVRCCKTQTLLDIDEDCNVGVIARYGYSSLPITSSWTQSSDGVIDTEYASFGATVSQFGTPLDDDLVANTPSEYISPDLTINAQTCLFPEKTWFIKNAKHSNNYDDLSNLIGKILYSNNEVTVNTYAEFPRFLAYDYATDTISADNSKPIQITQNTSLIERFKQIIASILEKIRLIFGNLF